MARMTGGEAIVDGLLRHGVDTVFGLPGVQVYGLFDAFARNSNRMRLIHTRHEQTTAYMAVGYACATGQPSAFSVVPGPGVMNTTAALVTGWGLNAPVMCLTGQVPSAQLGRLRGSLHEMPDQLATLKSMLKHADRIEHPTEAPYKVALAFHHMMSGRPSPVALEMPWDQFPAVADITPQDPLPLAPLPQPDSEKIAALAKLIDTAKAPMIWVGSGAIGAADEILALAEKLGCPVASFRTGRGIVDARHPLGLTVTAAANLWASTDLLIGIGTRMDTATGRWGSTGPGVKLARIDIDPAEMRRLKVDIGIVADAAQAVAALLPRVAPRQDAARAAAIAAAKARAYSDIRAKVQPQMGYIDAIRDVLPEDGILCDEMTQVGYAAWIGMPIYSPRTLITSGFSGTLGAGVPMALGVKVAHPDKTVISVTGDGGFLFGGAELATAVQFGINLIVVIFNNAAFGNVYRDQHRLFDGRDSGSALTNPDFQIFAKAFGVPSWRVTDAGGLKSAIVEAMAANSPCLIEVITDITKEPLPFEFFAPPQA